MSTQATVTSDTKSGMGDVLKTAGKIAEVGIDFGLLKKRLENAVEDTVLEAQRMAKHGRHAMGDVIDDTTYWVKRNPWHAVGCAAGAAFGIGLCLGWCTSRLSTSRDH